MSEEKKLDVDFQVQRQRGRDHPEEQGSGLARRAGGNGGQYPISYSDVSRQEFDEMQRRVSDMSSEFSVLKQTIDLKFENLNKDNERFTKDIESLNSTVSKNYDKLEAKIDSNSKKIETGLSQLDNRMNNDRNLVLGGLTLAVVLVSGAIALLGYFLTDVFVKQNQVTPQPTQTIEKPIIQEKPQAPVGLPSNPLENN